ncbi:Pycsar system effector family protein [Spirosoma utsteinense]|uniref:Metal-dependent HD superfamily phosphohydrolase n=1 Tax=Spirosoma utsteinense TaxID=2585773 RepID=A0ABR6W8W3_9BACT|nr:Pycsar system effector family protein [Spirosoma utsteinense]MBC3787563.1 putative metal-dependent HD superfamily phosphohydrolase [Spirosoma utsteinense]MBC3792250.1 putative metal-dependent HD superfamily phosphohydrolase [Spirosoma utsteinense]
MTTSLLHQVEAHVRHYFDQHARPDLHFHNLTHTEEVVRATDQFARHYQLSETDYLAVMAAAWFHDTGYLVGSPEEHEKRSADLAATFLKSLDQPAALVKQVKHCIRATRMPQSPTNLLEEILCDADLFHLGSTDYNSKQKQLRSEQETLTGTHISGRDWRQQNIDLLKSHPYYTDFAQTLLSQGQANNLNRLLEKRAEKEAVASPDAEASYKTVEPAAAPEFAAGDGRKGKDTKTERGVETMFRTTSTNHLRLSEIADSKANIMISVNSIMVSVLVSILPRRIEENPALMLPTALFLTTSMLTIIFAILATRPNITQGTFSHEDIQQKKGNLLFFGNFHQMSLGEFEWGIQELMKDNSYLYGSMTRDIYYLGLVLAKKYKLLRITYNVFMFGFVTSVLAFLVVFVTSEK